MKKEILRRNREYSEKFIQPRENIKSPDYLRAILSDNKIKSFIDLGCGDGIIIEAVKKEFPSISITGIDISPRRITGLRKRFAKETFYCMDVCKTGLKKKFDFVHSSQVIEHVPNDLEMISEMQRLLKRGGYLFVSSVIKNPWAIYQYRNNKKFVLDPTHEREYKSKEEFLKLFEKPNLKLIKLWTSPVKRRIGGIEIKIPGFYLVYGLWQKKK